MYEEVCYGKSFLKQVIVRIDFAAPLEKLSKGPPTRLVTPIAKNFPIIEPADVVMREVNVNDDGVDHRQSTERHWNYFSRERDRQLTLSSRAAFIQYNSYKSYEESKEHFSAFVDALGAVFPDTVVARFGLRYINQLEDLVDEPTQWSKYISPNLVAPRTNFGPEELLTRLVTIAELKYDQVGLRYQFGMPNPDYPAPIKRPVFVLDMDASVAEAHDLGRTKVYMDQAHERIQGLFERSITAELRERMNGK